MNTAALKNFAPAVRKQLMEAVTRKLDFALTAQTPDYLTTFASQVAALRKLAQADRAGLIERVAYTWFNRLAALRFIDPRGWHPFRSRVLTPADATETQPELLKLTRAAALPEDLQTHTKVKRLNDLLDGRAGAGVMPVSVLTFCTFPLPAGEEAGRFAGAAKSEPSGCWRRNSSAWDGGQANGGGGAKATSRKSTLRAGCGRRRR